MEVGQERPSALDPIEVTDELDSDASDAPEVAYDVLINGVCHPNCSSGSSDTDGDGWGWENSSSCVVQGSSVDNAGSSCNGGSGTATGSGFQIDGTCYPACSSSADSEGWGWENDRSCVLPGSSAANGASACTSGSSSQSGTSQAASGGNCPSSLSCPSGMSCGCYTVSGLGSNKSALRNAGASQYMLASAMMETELMNANYAYGDNKTGDSFNAGVCKQNWFMMRQCHSDWRNLGSGDYATSAAMNSSRALDVQVYNECRSHFGDSWWAGHRNGASGISNPNTQDIRNFRAAMDWTNGMLNGHLGDDVRFWVDVPAIERVSLDP